MVGAVVTFKDINSVALVTGEAAGVSSLQLVAAIVHVAAVIRMKGLILMIVDFKKIYLLLLFIVPFFKGFIF